VTGFVGCSREVFNILFEQIGPTLSHRIAQWHLSDLLAARREVT
jgi:hypothetical protein